MIVRLFLLILIFFQSSKLYTKEIPIIVISPGKSIQSYSAVGTDVEVLTSEDLNESEYNFLGDIIENSIPGANFFQSGGTGTQSKIQLRGLPGRYSTFYIDGVKMSDPSSSDNSYYISSIKKDSIERIEILKGSQSTLYGGNAIGGTINIFTKKGEKGRHQDYEISTGSNGTNNISTSLSGADDYHNFYLGLSSFSTDGISAMNDAPGANDDDSYTNQSIVSNYGYKINESTSLKGGLRFNDSLLNYDEVKAGRTDINNKTDDSELSYNVGLNYENGKLKNSLFYNYTEIERATKTYTNASNNYYGYRDSYNYLGEYNYDLDTRLVFGLENEFDKAKYKKDYPANYLTSREFVRSQFADLQFRHSEKLYQTFGVRRDTHSIAGGFSTYRSTLAYKLNNFSKLRTSLGTGIRFPTLYDYYYGTAVSVKEELRPERSKSFDIGYETNLEKINTIFDISAYKITYVNAIEGWDSLGWTQKNADADIESKGIELSSLWKPANNFNLGLNYSYTDTYDGADCDNPDMGTTYTVASIDCAMVRVPRHAVNSTINFKAKGINSKLLIKYSGETRDYGNTNNGFADVILDDYITFGYQADYKLNNRYKIYLSANNIFDQNYEQAFMYSTMGRTFNFGIKAGY
jgi:vitamin B12 transporter